MLGNLSIRSKLTLWFAAALIIIVSLAYLAVLAVSEQVIQKTVRDSLIETVEHNVDEVEYFSSYEAVQASNDVNQFLQYKQGFLEIDDDFLDKVNAVYTTLYAESGNMLYGENPIARETAEYAFSDSRLQSLKVQGITYYIFDRRLSGENLEGLWLRGVVAETQGEIQMTAIIRTTLFLLPLLVLITIVGGYLLAGRMLHPLRLISDSAEAISRGGDLQQRIEVGKDELQQPANNFNNMFIRLDESFRKERQFTSDASHELRTPMAVIMA